MKRKRKTITDEEFKQLLKRGGTTIGNETGDNHANYVFEDELF